jgi:hypothetical protein
VVEAEVKPQQRAGVDGNRMFAHPDADALLVTADIAGRTGDIAAIAARPKRR